MGRRKSYDRAAVLDRAMRVFWTKGYEGAHLSELLEATGLSRSSLYDGFGGKEGLYRAALEHYVDGLGDLLALLEREPLGVANVRAFHRAQLEHDFLHGCFALNTIREKHVVPRSAWHTIETFTEGLGARLRSNLRAAARSGELPPESDPDDVAGALAVFDMGLLGYRSLGAKPQEALRLVEQIERLLE